MSATIKNCHSPSGMGFYTGNVGLVTAKDCPGCRFGTLKLCENNSHRSFHCMDCGRNYTITLLKKVGVLPENFK
jgi:hypothetical protein